MMPTRPYKIQLSSDTAFMIQLDHDDVSQRDVLAHFSRGQTYEHETTSFLIRTLRPGDHFVDVGANAGYFALLASSLIKKSGSVLAAEANPASADLVRSSVALNTATLDNPANVTVETVAVSDHAGRVVFGTEGPRNSNGSVIVGKTAADAVELVSNDTLTEFIVDCVTLETLVERHGMPHIRAIKIDTEGHELSVLKGAASLLRQGRIDFIVCELNLPGLQRNGTDQNTLRAFVQQYGYQTFLFDHDGNLPVWVPPGVTIEQVYTCNILFAKPDSLAAHWPTILNQPASIRLLSKA